MSFQELAPETIPHHACRPHPILPSPLPPPGRPWAPGDSVPVFLPSPPASPRAPLGHLVTVSRCTAAMEQINHREQSKHTGGPTLKRKVVGHHAFEDEAPTSTSLATVSSAGDSAAGLATPRRRISEKRSQRTPSKKAREIAITESALLACQQIVRSCTSAETCSLMLSEQFVEKGIGKAKLRMTSSLIAMYSADFDPSSATAASESTGMKLLEGLRLVTQQLELLLPVAKAFRPLKGEGPHANILLQEIVKYNSSVPERQLPAVLFEVLLERAADDAWEENDNYAHFCQILSEEWRGSDDVKQSSRLHLPLLPVPKRAEFQDLHVSKGLRNLLRAENNLRKVETYMTAVRTLNMLPLQGGICEELPDFQKILWPMSSEWTPGDVASAQKKFEVTKTLQLWRPLYLFPTGKAIIDAVSHALEQRSADCRFVLQVEEVSKKMKQIPDLPDKSCVATDTGVVSILGTIRGDSVPCPGNERTGGRPDGGLIARGHHAMRELGAAPQASLI